MKTYLGRLAAVLGLLGLALVLAFAAAQYQLTLELQQYNKTLAPFNSLANRLRVEGIPAGLQAELVELPKTKYITGYALVDAMTMQVAVGEAADQTGKQLGDPALPWVGRDSQVHYLKQDIQTPDGHTYELAAFGQPPGAYGPLSNPLLGGAAVASLGLAWLALALWLFLDARLRSPADAYAWGLLGLLTGPVGLGVYRILRPAPEVCPGCGAVQEPGGSFCPACGFALRPACPECRQPVQHEWHYCRACGVPLHE